MNQITKIKEILWQSLADVNDGDQAKIILSPEDAEYLLNYLNLSTCGITQRKFLDKIEREGKEYCYSRGGDETGGTWEIGNHDTKIRYYSDDIEFKKVINGD